MKCVVGVVLCFLYCVVLYSSNTLDEMEKVGKNKQENNIDRLIPNLEKLIFNSASHC